MPMPKAAAMTMAREIVKSYLEHQQVANTAPGTQGGNNAADFAIAMLNKLSAFFEQSGD